MGFARSALFKPAVRIALIIFFYSGYLLNHGMRTLAQAKKPCGDSHCDVLRIDHISGTGIKYITASGRAGTYILSCIEGNDCSIPIEGKDYKTEFDDNGNADLDGPHVSHGGYSLEVTVPELSVSEVRSGIEKCQRSDQFANEGDCGRWLRRKLALLKAPCPEHEATTACESLHELIKGNDQDVMNDLAHQDHVYSCFLPGKDEFFQMTFSEPTPWSFKPPSAKQIGAGMPREALTTWGGSEFAYYKNGIGEGSMSLHNLGHWVYLPLGAKTDPASMRKNATSKQARFAGENIKIEGGRWTVTETYKNDQDTEMTYTVILELATGRFRDDLVLTRTGNKVAEHAGRCLIAPSTYF
jgi:hypothetical protein